jgi:galactokinase
VNLIGEHTDYNGGLALPFAVGFGVTVRAAPGPPSDEPFVQAVIRELAVPPAHVDVSSTVPAGFGLGSSAAFGVALTLALGALAGSPKLRRPEVAQLVMRVEHSLGAQTGLLDQMASLYGQAGHALLIDFSAVGEPVLVPLSLRNCRLVIVDSGERRANAASGYNLRRAECLRGVPVRLRHVRDENARVLASVDALAAGDMAGVGALLNESHASLRDLFSVSTPAVEATRDRLLDAGALGARIHGGGFGGGVLALLPPGVSRPPGAVEVTPSAGAWQDTAP